MEETEDRKKLGVKKTVWREEETLVPLISYNKNICNYFLKIILKGMACVKMFTIHY